MYKVHKVKDRTSRVINTFLAVTNNHKVTQDVLQLSNAAHHCSLHKGRNNLVTMVLCAAHLIGSLGVSMAPPS